MTAGVLSLTLWPHLLASRALPDRAALRLGLGCLALTSASLSLWSASARVLWAARRASADSSCPTPLPRPRRVLRTLLRQVLPLGTVAVGLVRSIPASLLTAAAPPAERGQRASAGHAAEREAAAVTGAAALL